MGMLAVACVGVAPVVFNICFNMVILSFSTTFDRKRKAKGFL